jgi:hypothetical protein
MSDDWMDDFDLVKSLEALRDLKVELALYLEQVATLEKRCKAWIKETGEMPDVEGVELRVSRGYTVVRVDQKAVKEDARTRPELEIYLQEKQVAPGLRIIIE